MDHRLALFLGRRLESRGAGRRPLRTTLMAMTLSLVAYGGLTAAAAPRSGATNANNVLKQDATCTKYLTGRASPQNQIVYLLNEGSETPTNDSDSTAQGNTPGAFFYYSQFVAPSSNFTVNIDQIIVGANPATFNPGSNFLFEIPNSLQVQVFDQNCDTLKEPTPTISGANESQATTQITNATTGLTYIVGVKYSTKIVSGDSVTDPHPTVQYAFQTKIGGSVVDSNQNGLFLTPASTTP